MKQVGKIIYLGMDWNGQAVSMGHQMTIKTFLLHPITTYYAIILVREQEC